MIHCQSAEELAKKVSVLDAVRWISCAVKDIKITSVKNCLAKSGIIHEQSFEESDENLISAVGAFITDQTDPLDYINIDENLSTELGYRH